MSELTEPQCPTPFCSGCWPGASCRGIACAVCGPRIPRCGKAFAFGAVCVLRDGHEGDHQ